MIPGNALEVGKTLCALLLRCLGPQDLHLITVANLHTFSKLFTGNLSERLAQATVAQPGYAANPIDRVHDVAVDEEPLDGLVILLQYDSAYSKVAAETSKVRNSRMPTSA